MRATAALVACFVIITGAVTLGSCAPVEEPATAGEFEQLVGTEWYSVRIFGQPSGWARIETQLAEGGENPRLRLTQEVKVLVSLGGQKLEANTSQVGLFDERLRPVSIELDKNELGRRSHLSATLADGRLIVRTGSDEPGTPEPEERTLDLPADFASDLIVPVRLLRGELEVGDQIEYSAYDPETDVMDTRTVTVEEPEEINGTEALVIRTQSQKLGIEVLSWVTEDGTMLRQTAPGLLDLTLERVSEEEALTSVAPFELSNTIAVEHRLPNVRSLRQVRLRIHRDVGDATELIPGSHRQSVEADGEDALVTVDAEEPPQQALSLPIEDESVARFLQPTRHIQCDDSRIIDLAQEIVGEETDAWSAAQKLCSWVYSELGKVESEPRPISALEVLDQMRGDCTEHAVLMAALGRAAGIPTRMATGLAYIGGRFGYHAWTEVWIGRWVEMDPSWGEMTADAGHMLIYASSLDPESYARAALATGRTIGAVQMRLIGYTTPDGGEVTFEEN